MTTAGMLPRLTAAFAAAAVALGQSPPTISSLEPAHDAVDVEPREATRLVITFDQDMDPARHDIAADGTSLPRIVREGWADARTYVLHVEVETDRLYSLTLSPAGSAGFTTAGGRRLPATLWRFATRGAPLAEGAGVAAGRTLFTALRNDYAHRDRLGVDWTQLERQHGERFATAGNGASLALVVADVLAAAQDPQVSVRWNEHNAPTYARDVVGNDDAAAIERTFGTPRRLGQAFAVARSKDDIGYLLVESFAREHARAFDQVLQALRGMLDCKGLVLDLRTNAGGDEALARRLAAFFVDGDHVFAQLRPTAGDDSKELRLRGNGPPDTFPGPVAVLQGRLTMGTAEAFLLMMRKAPRATTVGERSYGSAGENGAAPLAAGLTIVLPKAKLVRPDGVTFEGEGLEPHIHVASAQKPGDADPVLVEAMQRLRNPR